MGGLYHWTGFVVWGGLTLSALIFACTHAYRWCNYRLGVRNFASYVSMSLRGEENVPQELVALMNELQKRNSSPGELAAAYVAAAERERKKAQAAPEVGA